MLSGIAGVAGCSKSGASSKAESLARRLPRRISVRIGPLVSEHPLYPEVTELTSFLAAAETADLERVKAFLASPLGRSLAPPRSVAEPGTPPARWASKADAELAARLSEAEGLLGSWPRPELARTRRRMTAEADDALRDRRGQAAMEAVRAEMWAIEERKGLLAELRQRAASDDQAQIADAMDRQVELWREIAAQAEAVRREADQELRLLERDYDGRLAEATAQIAEAADADRDRQLGGLAEEGTAVRALVGPAAEAAIDEVEPTTNATEAPAPPQTSGVTELVHGIESAHQAAWERRRGRLAAARSRLLQRIADDTRNAVRAVAVPNGIEVCFDCVDHQDLPDVTEEFRALLRDHWAARAATVSQQAATATQ
jgi:hypothetical protein